MKIVIASSGLGHVARGIETWAADLTRALLARGLNVTLCKGGGQPISPHEKVLNCWQRSSNNTRRLLTWLPSRLTWRLGLASPYGIEQTTFAIALIDHLRQNNIDLLHVQDPQVALIVQRAQKVDVIKTRTILAHGTEEPPTFLKKITYLQHLTPWHLTDAREAGAYKPTWQAIPNFVDTNQFCPGPAGNLRAQLGIPASALVLLSVAAIKRKHKRIDYLVNEFAQLRQQNPTLPAWLIIAGSQEPGTDELIQEAKNRLGERVKFLIRFPRNQMPDLYRTADLFTLASLKEMMPIALLEAMSSGLPCITQHHPVLQWMTGARGETIDMQTPGALAHAATTLFLDTQRRAAISTAIRRHCQSNFSTDTILKQILNYYHFVMTHDQSITQPHRQAA